MLKPMRQFSWTKTQLQATLISPNGHLRKTTEIGSGCNPWKLMIPYTRKNNIQHHRNPVSTKKGVNAPFPRRRNNCNASRYSSFSRLNSTNASCHTHFHFPGRYLGGLSTGSPMTRSTSDLLPTTVSSLSLGSLNDSDGRTARGLVTTTYTVASADEVNTQGDKRAPTKTVECMHDRVKEAEREATNRDLPKGKIPRAHIERHTE